MEQLAFHYMNRLMNNDPIKGHVLNVGLGVGYSARFLLDKRSVLSVTTIERDQARIDAYTFSDDLERRHNIIKADAETFTDTGKFDFIFVDIIQDHEPSTYKALRDFSTNAKRFLANGGAMVFEFQADVPEERQFREVWLPANFTKEKVRDALAFRGRRGADQMVVYRKKD